MLALKNTLDGMTSRFMLQNKKVNEREDMAIENLQSEIQRERKRFFKNKKWISDLRQLKVFMYLESPKKQ